MARAQLVGHSGAGCDVSGAWGADGFLTTARPNEKGIWPECAGGGVIWRGLRSSTMTKIVAVPLIAVTAFRIVSAYSPFLPGREALNKSLAVETRRVGGVALSG